MSVKLNFKEEGINEKLKTEIEQSLAQVNYWVHLNIRFLFLFNNFFTCQLAVEKDCLKTSWYFREGSFDSICSTFAPEETDDITVMYKKLLDESRGDDEERFEDLDDDIEKSLSLSGSNPQLWRLTDVDASSDSDSLEWDDTEISLEMPL